MMKNKILNKVEVLNMIGILNIGIISSLMCISKFWGTYFTNDVRTIIILIQVVNLTIFDTVALLVIPLSLYYLIVRRNDLNLHKAAACFLINLCFYFPYWTFFLPTTKVIMTMCLISFAYYFIITINE